MKRKKRKKSKRIKKSGKNRHSLYHKNFSNMTPVEIINFLVEYYWKGQWKWVIRALIEKDNTRET